MPVKKNRDGDNAARGGSKRGHQEATLPENAPVPTASAATVAKDIAASEADFKKARSMLKKLSAKLAKLTNEACSAAGIEDEDAFKVSVAACTKLQISWLKTLDQSRRALNIIPQRYENKLEKAKAEETVDDYADFRAQFSAG